jgi:hypothetical protein
MRRLSFRTMGYAFIASLCAVDFGCGTGTPTRTEKPRKSSSAEALPPTAPHASLAELLAKPRAELATLYEETAAQVQIREKAHREGTLAFGLLPRLRLPLIVPIWAEASYSAKSKISLPPYLPESAKDNALALHLARFGDVEAARALAEVGRATIGKEIDGLAYERNYPAEWTRLTALLLHTAEYSLASGDDGGRAELASLHKQLREILGAKAAKGPLGAALLSQGRKVLSLAAAEWRDTGHPDLADKADDDLAAWGELPAPATAVPFSASSKSVAAMLRSQAHGRAVVALNSNRALDVLELPVTGEGAEGVVAIFDPDDKLAEVLVSYRARIADYFLEPAHLVLPLEDHGDAGKDRAQVGSVHRREYRLGKSTCEVSVVPRGYVTGAFVRFIGGENHRAPALSRDFGSINLDRTYGQNRVRLMPEQVGDTVQTSKGPSLAKIANPLAPLVPATAVLQRDGWHDLVKSFTMIYNVDENTPPLFQTALPLWSAYGPAGIETLEDKEGGLLVLTWKDGRTQYALRMPHVSGRPFEFEVTDPRGADTTAARVTAAWELEATEREHRLEKKQPLIRIPRRVDIGLANYPSAIGLEMSRDQVAAILPRGKSVVTQDGPDFVNVLFTGDPPKSAARTTRQAFIRFGPNQKVAEIRTRTVAGSSPRWISEMLAGLSKSCGAPLDSQSNWSTIWSDLPARKPVPVLGRWQDDVAWMTAQRDGTTVELIVHDCPLDHPAGVPLPPFAYLPRGPEGVALGDLRNDLIKRFNVDTPRTLDDGGLVLLPSGGGVYDAFIVWFEKDRVSRIVARVPAPTVQPGKKPPTAADQITQTWGRSVRSLGWPTRQDSYPDGSVQSLGWHDDVTRVRIFAQDSEDGVSRVFTEWKDVPELKTK